jgi:hypothetical protein
MGKKSLDSVLQYLRRVAMAGRGDANDALHPNLTPFLGKSV